MRLIIRYIVVARYILLFTRHFYEGAVQFRHVNFSLRCHPAALSIRLTDDGVATVVRIVHIATVSRNDERQKKKGSRRVKGGNLAASVIPGDKFYEQNTSRRNKDVARDHVRIHNT